MNANRFPFGRHVERTAQSADVRRAFTLIELLVVVTIIGILMAALGAVLANTARKAREAATISVIQKIDGLLQDRIKGFERFTKSRYFQQTVDSQRILWDDNFSLLPTPRPSVSRKFAEAATRKDFYRANFPQRYEEMADSYTYPNNTTIASNSIPDLIEFDPVFNPEDANGNGVLDAGEDTNRNGKLDGYIHAKHNRETESGALLNYMLTKMQAFGVPPVGESEFSTSELRDTDGDGLLEFIDGWGRPLRFYRWPTRLLKPNGIVGADNQPGRATVDDNNNGTVDDFMELGTISTDDVIVASPSTFSNDIRSVAGLLIEGLPRVPVIAGQWDPLSEDPDDPYGLVSTEFKRVYSLSPSINLTAFAAPPAKRYLETLYPTLDTYHTPLILSVGPDNDSGLFEPYQGTDTNGDGVPDSDLGILAQPSHGAAPYDIGSDVFSALSDNITNRNRRAGKGK